MSEAWEEQEIYHAEELKDCGCELWGVFDSNGERQGEFKFTQAGAVEVAHLMNKAWEVGLDAAVVDY